jgi:lipopolysaccharide export system protein LptC
MTSAWLLIRRLADQLAIYLPLLLMAALALGSYWLVRNAPVTPISTGEKALRHEADYFLSKFSVKSFTPQGNLKTELFGGQARHFADTDTIEIDNVRVHNFSQTGRLSTVTRANKAISNGDNSEIQLYGNASSVREAAADTNGVMQPKMEFKGEFLHTFVDEERLKSHLPIVIRRGSSEFSADSLDYDNIARVINLQGRVKAVLQPTK